jgi:hypothetical protein
VKTCGSMTAVLCAWICVTSGCGDEQLPDGADGAVELDAIATADAIATTDASPMFPLAGFGAITGACDVLDTELSDSVPSVFESAIAFDREYTDSDLALLTDGGAEIIADGNAGGSSLLSEVFAYEVLQRCELAILLKTETEIEYDEMGSLTDFLAEIDGSKLGVSVTRAVGFPRDDPYTVQQAQSLLEDKLAGVLESSSNVSMTDVWQKQILTVLAYGPDHAESLGSALDQIDTALTADTIVWIVVTNGTDSFIYD